MRSHVPTASRLCVSLNDHPRSLLCPAGGVSCLDIPVPDLPRLYLSRYDLSDIQELRRSLGQSGDRIAKHGVAEGASRANRVGARSQQFFRAGLTDSRAAFFSKKNQTTARPAAE
jgi:hypothetical protein